MRCNVAPSNAACSRGQLKKKSHRVRVGKSPLSKAIGNQQTEETLHKTVLKAVRKTRRLAPMLRF